ncbi:hypothetical protein C2E23DRAFT_825027 [Lenzites betulinus]|nr:hypothetical protein C2E23DRAFT_825027 [Lenzites betulinus]
MPPRSSELARSLSCGRALGGPTSTKRCQILPAGCPSHQKLRSPTQALGFPIGRRECTSRPTGTVAVSKTAVIATRLPAAAPEPPAQKCNECSYMNCSASSPRRAPWRSLLCGDDKGRVTLRARAHHMLDPPSPKTPYGLNG